MRPRAWCTPGRRFLQPQVGGVPSLKSLMGTKVAFAESQPMSGGSLISYLPPPLGPPHVRDIDEPRSTMGQKRCNFLQVKDKKGSRKMEAKGRSCDLCYWSQKPARKKISFSEETFDVCLDCYVKIIEEILDKLVKDEHERVKLIVRQFRKVQELNRRLEWDFERPPLIDSGPLSYDDYFPEVYQGLIEFKHRP